VLTVTVILWGVYQYRRALVPVIRPDAVISSSWVDLPITARNAGDIFDLREARFFCDVKNVTFKGAGTTAFRMVGDAEYMVPRPPITIEPGVSATFPCDVSSNVTAKYENGVQMPVALIHMRIRTTYAINLGLFDWHRESKSQLFTWREVSGGYQWLEGDTSDAIKRN
jgi:hypothetical protein